MKFLVVVLSFLVFHTNGYLLNKGRHFGKHLKKLQQNRRENFQRTFPNSNDISQDEENANANYFEGDVLLTQGQSAILHHIFDTPSRRRLYSQASRRGLVKSLRRTWKDAIVYYTIHPNVGRQKRRTIKKAMEHWERKTCLLFKKRTNQIDFIEFKQSNRCASFIGRKGGKQVTYIGNRKRCFYGNIIHEIGHSVGFFHEQSRPDRDEHVNIKWENIMPKLVHNFRKYPETVIDSRHFPYDYGSVMHYSRKAFSKNRTRLLTIRPRKKHAFIGQRKHLSRIDAEQAKSLYNCNLYYKRNFST